MNPIIKMSIALMVMVSSNTLLAIPNSKVQVDNPMQSNKPTIRVAIRSESWPAHYETNAMGKLYGIDIDYIKSVLKKLNVAVEFIQLNDKSALQRLRDGTIDLMLSAGVLTFYDSDLVVSLPLYESNTATWYGLTNSNTSIPPEELTFTCVRGTVYCEFAKERNPKNIVIVERFNQGMEVVTTGKADAFIDSYTAIIKFTDELDINKGSMRISEPSKRVPIVVTGLKKNLYLVNSINEAIRDMNNEKKLNKVSASPYHLNDQSITDYRSINKKESTIRYSQNEYYPLFYKTSDGKLAGYVYDFVNLLKDHSGLIFEYVPNKGRSVLDMLKNNEIDFIPLIGGKSLNIDEIVHSEPYIKLNYVNLTRRDKIKDESDTFSTGMLKQGSVIYGMSSRLLQDGNIKVYEDIKAMFEDLDNGSIDAILMVEDLAKTMIMRNEEDQYKIVIDDDHPVRKLDFSIGVSKNKPLLVDVLNSVLKTINVREIQYLVNSYKKFDVVYGYEKETINTIAIFSIGLIIAIIISVYFWFNNLRLQITVRKISEQKNKQQILWLQNVIAEMPDLIVIHNKEMSIVLSNEKYDKNFNRIERLSYENIQIATKDNFITKPLFEQVLNDELEIRSDAKVTVKGGANVHFSVTHQQVIDPASQDCLVLSIYHDITEIETQKMELVQATSIAERAVNARSQFLATMSHELRTPIAGMIGLLEMLRSQIKSPDELFLIDNISASCKNLQLLVTDILDFSKIEAQQLRLNISKSNIYQIMGELLRLHDAVANEKELEFEVNWEPSEFEFIEIDSLRLGQVLNNLLSNAIKFTEKGKITIDINTSKQWLCISIEDTGIGMSEAQLSRVFTPFEQADGSTARKYGGTGLGLSIVNKLVNLMSGKLKFSSNLGTGTKVELCFPNINGTKFKSSIHSKKVSYDGSSSLLRQWMYTLNIIEVAHDEADLIIKDVSSKIVEFRSKEVKSEPILLSLNPFYPDMLTNVLKIDGELKNKSNMDDELPLSGTVLVAEDNPINRMLIEKQLDSIGLNFKTVVDGEQAFIELKQFPERYDLLITDYHMPNMDGCTLARNVRNEIELFDDKSIIGITAEISKSLSCNIKGREFDKVLYKPYNLVDLKIVLKECLFKQGEIETSKWLSKFDNKYSEEIANIFIETMGRDMSDLILYIQNDDIREIKKIVHRIKGGAIAIGAKCISDIAVKVEDAMANDDVEIINYCTELIKAMENEIEIISFSLNINDNL